MMVVTLQTIGVRVKIMASVGFHPLFKKQLEEVVLMAQKGGRERCE